MKRAISIFLAAALAGSLLAGCSRNNASNGAEPEETPSDLTEIALSDSSITVDGQTASTEETAAVYTAHDIVYYEDGQDFTYGAGSEADAHSQEEADAHTVIHITQPGTYALSGTLSAGQVAVDLGEDAKTDPDAVVTLVLSGVDITCTVAPAIIFYRVYECGSDDAETAGETVDTTAAGANIIIADGTENNVTGSYVAKIYKPETVTLNEDGTAVEEAKKLHKYDGALYSKMSMNVDGGALGTGILNIRADNEGLDSELHLTVNSGNINILAGNDGINTNEDGVSVTTVNGGTLTVQITGETGEGDGIDSNGWIVINGGTVVSSACSDSADSGLDSDNGIYINGGTVIAGGNMYDAAEVGGQNCAVFRFAQKQGGGQTYTLKNAAGETILEMTPANSFQYLVVSSPDLTEGEYTLWQGGTQLGGSTGSAGGPGAQNGETPPELPKGQAPEQGASPDGQSKPEGTLSEGAPGEKPEGRPGEDGTGSGQTPPEPPADSQRPENGPSGGWDGGSAAERSAVFNVQSGVSQFVNVGTME